jgi:hypothetical protein
VPATNNSPGKSVQKPRPAQPLPRLRRVVVTVGKKA